MVDLRHIPTKWWLVSGAVVVLVIAAIAGGGSRGPAGATYTAPPAYTPPPLPTYSAPAVAAPTTPKPAKTSDPAVDPAAVNAALLDSFGVTSWQALCTSMAGQWPCYVASVSTVSPHVLLVTLQVDQVDKVMGDQAGRAVLGLVGKQFPGMSYVQVNNAGGRVIGNVSRSSVALAS